MVELDHGTILYKVKQVLEDLVVELQDITLEQVAEMVQELQVKVIMAAIHQVQATMLVVEAEQDPAKAPPLRYARMGQQHLSAALSAAGLTITD